MKSYLLAFAAVAAIAAGSGADLMETYGAVRLLTTAGAPG